MAAVIVATMISLAIYSQAYTMNSLMRIATKSTEDRIKTNVKIVHVSLNSSESGMHLVAFAKNVGLRPISSQELSRADVYAGEGDCQNLFIYGGAQAAGGWDYVLVDLNGDGLWSPGETAVLRIYIPAAFDSYVCVKLVLPNGVGDEVYAYV